MLSRRSSFPAAPNRWSVLRDAVARRGRPVLDLTESNPTAVGIPYPDEDIRTALNDPGLLRYQPDPLGLPSAREAIADRYTATGTPIDASRIVLTASTSESYAFLFKLLADPGDAVLVPAPGYPLFEFLGRLESVVPVPYPLDGDDGWSIDAAALEAAARARVRALIVVNPQNPTGRFLSLSERDRIVPLCRDHGWAWISDEVFADYGCGASTERVRCAAHGAETLTFSLGGLSKSAGLPGMKLGWIAIGGAAKEVGRAMERLAVIADAFLSVSTASQLAAPALLVAGDLVRPRIRERVERNRGRLAAATDGTACRLLTAEGGWYGVLQVPATRTGEEWALRLLENDGVLVHPGYFYDFPREAYLVVSLLPLPDVLDEAAGRLVARITREA